MALARDANVLFCEAAFITADAEPALRTGHLTTRAGGEIAMAANVAALIPFHFSRRYQREPERVYAEIWVVCPRLMASRAAFTGSHRPAR